MPFNSTGVSIGYHTGQCGELISHGRPHIISNLDKSRYIELTAQL